ncbi:ATP-binding protein [Photobacterium sp. TLY01]|uniref:ATP-binding protein n=1 Tax=Photobacterium sp. TLY01 TaxID=2907534 RepID=UPI001F34C8BB|nr:ATP-binding protein [Photobacterium sp. TLY01]UIP28866.1 ATP-binding protein [Photobacterium sp. TLY01]
MNAFQRLQARVPAHIKPYTAEQMAAIRQQEAEKTASKIRNEHLAAVAAKAVGRSGIRKKHIHCRFENYYTHTPQQRQTFAEVRRWFDGFLAGKSGGFIFAGTSGTGKNHLACAMGNELLSRKRSVLVITVAELMSKFHEAYSTKNTTEAAIIRYLSGVHYLVIDEVGRQRMSVNEQVLLGRIIDGRYQNELPTGILTNLEQNDLIAVLGEASVDRIMEDGGAWLSFNWPSYRRNKHMEKAA